MYQYKAEVFTVLVWLYPEITATSLRVDNPHLEVKNAKKTIYSRI